MTAPQRSNTQRGFSTFDEFVDSHGFPVAVRESSAVACEGDEDPGPWVWVFCMSGDTDWPPHLNPAQARRLAAALTTFADENSGPGPDPDVLVDAVGVVRVGLLALADRMADALADFADERHQQRAGSHICDWCGCRWPCDHAQAIDALRAWREATGSADTSADSPAR